MAASRDARSDHGGGLWCVIPAAGRGERLGAGSAVRSKAFLTIGGRTLLERIVCGLDAEVSGITVVVAARDDRPLARSPSGLPIRYAIQPAPIGVADALRRAGGPDGHPVVVVMGDTYYDGPLGPYIAAWKASGYDGAVLVEPVRDLPGGAAGFVDLRGREVARVWKAGATGREAWRVAGMMILPSGARAHCAAIPANPATGERELEDAAERMLGSGATFLALRYEGWRRNINAREDLRRVEAHVAGDRRSSIAEET